MSLESTPEDEPILIFPDIPPERPPDIAFVVPASVYDSIDTDDELAPRPEAVDRAEITPSPDPPADSPALREAVEGLAASLTKRLDGLQAVFEREIRAEATREKVVDRLHAELQEYKQDLLLKVMRPVFIDLIQLHDDIGKMVEANEDGDEAVGRLLHTMRDFQQGIEDILYRQGVEPFTTDGDAFDPRRQRAVATVAADDPERNKTIAARHRKGFQAGDKVIRAEVVSVYAWKKI